MASGLARNGIDDNEVRNNIILRDPVYQAHTLLAMHRYASALKMDTKHVYHALPRLLSLWFDLVSVGRDQTEPSSKQDPLCKYTGDKMVSISSTSSYFRLHRLAEASSKSSQHFHGKPDTRHPFRCLLHCYATAYIKGHPRRPRNIIGSQEHSAASSNKVPSTSNVASSVAERIKDRGS